LFKPFFLLNIANTIGDSNFATLFFSLKTPGDQAGPAYPGKNCIVDDVDRHIYRCKLFFFLEFSGLFVKPGN
jgi:hypothetical protein